MVAVTNNEFSVSGFKGPNVRGQEKAGESCRGEVASIVWGLILTSPNKRLLVNYLFFVMSIHLKRSSRFKGVLFRVYI